MILVFVYMFAWNYW